GLGLVYPAAVLLVLIGLVGLLGGIGSAAHALRRRRLQRGPGRWDRTWVGVAFPAHLLLAALLTLPGVLVGAAGAAIVWILGVDSLPMDAVLPGAVAVAALLVWWTPSSGRAREGERGVLREVAPRGLGGGLGMVAGSAIAAVGRLACRGGGDGTPG